MKHAVKKEKYLILNWFDAQPLIENTHPTARRIEIFPGEKKVQKKHAAIQKTRRTKKKKEKNKNPTKNP